MASSFVPRLSFLLIEPPGHPRNACPVVSAMRVLSSHNGPNLDARVGHTNDATGITPSRRIVFLAPPTWKCAKFI
jgi:hypothetical protein